MASTLVDQLAFLRRYEAALNDGSPTGVTRCFEFLSEDIRCEFTNHIDLVHFCKMRKHLPEEISSWRTPGDVAPSIIRLYKQLILTKLVDSNYNATDALVEDLYDVISSEALEFLRDNSVTFSEDDLIGLKRKCQKILDSKGKCNSEIVLSVLLKEEETKSKGECKSYAFSHKTVQVMFAADNVVRRILTHCNVSLNSILAVTTCGMTHLLEVLLHVVPALSRFSPHKLEERWEDLKKALRDAGVIGADNVRDCVARCSPDHAGMVAEIAALVADVRWNVCNGRHVAAVVEMLQYGAPRKLWVHMKAEALRGAPWGALVAAAGSKGVEVWLCLECPDDYEPHDDLLLPLRHSGVRLGGFIGCVGTCAGVAALASCVDTGADLYIHMAAPLDLSVLGGTYEELTVYTRPLPPPGPASPTWPLPPSPPPSLYVEGTTEGSWRAVARTIISLAPPGKRFHRLGLPACRLRAVELPQLRQFTRDECLQSTAERRTLLACSSRLNVVTSE
ncbi:uncharacterized protein LOC125178326 [Hyalella azteca]|uniref:Uncharacterized protein LOC125178326 n=1 Tax=Hyalella azteca TaxID=294128 RepID=A0A979FL70_HYAAZ|nr:uncharacterized protein LOC125178326 [Hyalella azteca]